ncbi:MAG: SMC-Scp complex subunit ScpB [Deltaproteobacteria bacterium]|jgi:segregation and condensation protein B|nr:SMC-Scp complex subunit ScpB [Deltaproteobacteria bacterium]
MVEGETLKPLVESLIFAAGEPVSLVRLVAVIGEAGREAIRRCLEELAADYAAPERGIALEHVAGGYAFRTKKQHADCVRRLLAAKPPRLSRAMLETVAIVAYRQPVTRAEIEQLRGVDSGAVLEGLLERRLVKIAGRKESVGRPLIYATTPEFLEFFGLAGLEELPELGGLPLVQPIPDASNGAGLGAPAYTHNGASHGAGEPSLAGAEQDAADPTADPGLPGQTGPGGASAHLPGEGKESLLAGSPAEVGDIDTGLPADGASRGFAPPSAA